MKKYILYVFFLIVIIVMALNRISAKDYLPLLGKVIVIDPGHGGIDPGTIYGDIYEKILNLAISINLAKTLELYGGSVIMTRSGDYDLASPNASFRKRSDFNNRIKLINNSKADLYLSIHMNYLSDSRYYGPQVFYAVKNNQLAQEVQKRLNVLADSDRNIKKFPADTYMYDKLNIDGLLIECGFLSNQEERNKLNSPSYQQQLSESIVMGLISYFS